MTNEDTVRAEFDASLASLPDDSAVDPIAHNIRHGHDGQEECARKAFDAARVAPPAGVEGWISVPKCSVDERSWPEDRGDRYANECVHCQRTFYGNKRRVACKACAAPPQVELQTAGAVALRALIRAYVNLLENARDRIVERGGQCDPVDVMERRDPALIAAKAALAAPSPRAEEAAPTGAWQLIETAPKVRTLLLGYFNSHGKWRTLRGRWFARDVIDSEWENPDCDEGWYETSVECDDVPNCWRTQPTHWMPLPLAHIATPRAEGASDE